MDLRIQVPAMPAGTDEQLLRAAQKLEKETARHTEAKARWKEEKSRWDAAKAAGEPFDVVPLMGYENDYYASWTSLDAAQEGYTQAVNGSPEQVVVIDLFGEW